MQAHWLRPTGTLARLVHDPLPSLALRPAHGRADSALRADGVRPKRKKPFEAEWALLKELGLA